MPIKSFLILFQLQDVNDEIKVIDAIYVAKG